MAESKMYIVVNNTLKMGKGKIAAQVGHGVAGMTRVLEKFPNTTYDQWKKGMETKIVLQADGTTMEELSKRFVSFGYCLPIFDAGKTQIEKGSFTVLTFRPMLDGEVPEELKSLKLL
jgi:peptidyl-tRNA hydrolase, PTH2 family